MFKKDFGDFNKGDLVEELIYEGKELKKLAYFNTANLGEIKKDKIQRIYDLYNLMGLIDKPVDLEKFVFDTSQQNKSISKIS